jgi:dTDP-3,4-didehydro-2,6-dideoxy-alpha-D-glucose 3-reductase
MNFAIVGCGSIAQKSVIPAFINSEKCNLVVCIDWRENKRDLITSKFNIPFETSLAIALNKYDFDAVYVATPIGVHKKAILEAVNNGKHVLCEKSIVPNYTDAEEIVLAGKNAGVSVFEGFMYQFHDQQSEVRKIIDSGTIGDIFHYQAWFGFPPIKETDFRYNPELGGGALLDAGSYTVHSARHLFKTEPIEVFSVLEKEGRDVELRGSVLLNFGKSRTAHLVFGFNNMYQNKFEMWGTKGRLSLNRAFAVPDTFQSKLIIEKQDFFEEILMPKCNHFQNEIEYFINNYGNLNARNEWYQEILNQAKVISKIRTKADRSKSFVV